MYEENDINYDFDYDDEKKTVRKSIGMICLLVGILLFIAITYFFVRDIKLATTGNCVTATIEKKDDAYKAVYVDESGREHTYDLETYVNIFHRKTIGIYYAEKLSEGTFIYWEIYLISYILYGFMIFAGICNLKNKSAFKTLWDCIRRKKKTAETEEKTEE